MVARHATHPLLSHPVSKLDQLYFIFCVLRHNPTGRKNFPIRSASQRVGRIGRIGKEEEYGGEVGR